MATLSELLDPTAINSAAQTGKTAPQATTALPVDPVQVQVPMRLPANPTTAAMPAPQPAQTEPEVEHVASWKERIKEITSDKALMGAGLITLAGFFSPGTRGKNGANMAMEGLERGVQFYSNQKARDAEKVAQEAQTDQGERRTAVDEGTLLLAQNAQPAGIESTQANTAMTQAKTALLPEELALEKEKLKIMREKNALDKALGMAKAAVKPGNVTEADLKLATVEALMEQEGLSQSEALLRVGGLDFKSQVKDITEKQAGAGEDQEAMADTRRAVWINELGQKGANTLERSVTGLQKKGLMSTTFAKGSTTPIVRFPGLQAEEENDLLDAYDKSPKLYAEKISKLAARENTIEKAEGTLLSSGFIKRDKTGATNFKAPPAISAALNKLKTENRDEYLKRVQALASDPKARDNVSKLPQ